MLPKLRSLESVLPPINRLPVDVFTLIPYYFTNDGGDWNQFPMNKPLITMTHVCRSWRGLLLSTPSLWTRIDFSTTESQQAQGFLSRSKGGLLKIYQFFESEEHVEPFLSTTLRNTHRLQRLDIDSFLLHLDRVLIRLTRPAPELRHLGIKNERDITGKDIRLLSTIFDGRLPKLTSLTLSYLHTDLCGFNFPSLTKFNFTTGTMISMGNLTSFLEGCPLLESVQICLYHRSHPPTHPPGRRHCLPSLKELRSNQTACISGLLDHLVLPNCTEMALAGLFMGDEFADWGFPAAQIHPSSIDHLPVTRGITKAVAMPGSCILSGPSGNLRFQGDDKIHRWLSAEYFTSFFPISVLEIRELRVGWSTTAPPVNCCEPWKQTTTRVRGMFRVLSKVEDLSIVNCQTEPFFSTLGAAADDRTLLLGLRRLTIFVGCADLAVLALIQCAKTRKEYSQPLEEVTIVFEKEPGADLVEGMESLRGFVGELTYRVGKDPDLIWWGGGHELWE